MKRILLLLTLGAILTCPSLAKADDSTTPTPTPSGPPPGAPHRLGFLTDAERQELKTAHDAAIAADPSLATQEAALKSQMQAAHEAGTPPTDADKAQWQAFRDKMNAAMIAADPAVAPILAKIKDHPHRDGAGGPPPTPPASS